MQPEAYNNGIFSATCKVIDYKYKRYYPWNFEYKKMDKLKKKRKIYWRHTISIILEPRANNDLTP